MVISVLFLNSRLNGKLLDWYYQDFTYFRVNKLACHSFMDADRRTGDSWIRDKGFFTLRSSGSTNFMFTPVLLVPQVPSVQFSSVHFNHSVVSDSLRPHRLQHRGFLVHHRLPELAQTHVYLVSDAIQTSHPLSSPSPPAFNLSQHQGLFQWVSSSHQVAKVLESASASVLPMDIQDSFPLGLTGWISLQSKRLSRVFSNTTWWPLLAIILVKMANSTQINTNCNLVSFTLH